MNAPPDWQDGECCFRCRTQFSLVARKHHCRNCGNIFCAKCSSQQIPLPKLNIEKNVRVCDTCYEKISAKNQDPLTLALGPSEDKESKSETSTKQKSQSYSKSSSTSAPKSGSSASAPSEQELKEEEELQLALALSLSETPTKVSFPDYRHLEETSTTTSTTTKVSVSNTGNTTTPKVADYNAPQSNNIPSNDTPTSSTSVLQEKSPHLAAPGYDMPPIYSVNAVPDTTSTINQPKQPSLQQQPSLNQQASTDYHGPDRDHELYKFIGEVHATLEVFNNRLEACTLRSRPVSRDAAIQSTFIKLNSEIQPKISEYKKTYEDERSYYERLQDKLSQIADARAALDDLRQEHQEKMRQLTAEAERQRQSQLASKLEAMRQKKSEMMQYQRELALQKIREQEMMYQQPPQQQQMPHEQSLGEVQSTNPMINQTMYQQATYDQPGQQQVAQNHISTPSVQPQSIMSGNQQQQWQQPSSQGIQYNQPYAARVPSASAYATPSNGQPQNQGQQHYNPYVPHTQASTIPQAQQAIDRSAIAQLEKQYLPDAKPDEEAPLISFDD